MGHVKSHGNNMNHWKMTMLACVYYYDYKLFTHNVDDDYESILNQLVTGPFNQTRVPYAVFFWLLMT